MPARKPARLARAARPAAAEPAAAKRSAGRASLRAHFDAQHVATGRAVEKALRSAWRALQKETKGERLFALAVYTSGQDALSYATISACTEEGLDEAARAYLARHPDATLERERAALRWNACDWPTHDHTGVPLPALGKTVAFRTRIEDDAIWEAFAGALERCDREGLFGRGEAREALTLAILCGDMDGRFFARGVRRLNPPRVARRAQREWREALRLG